MKSKLLSFTKPIIVAFTAFLSLTLLSCSSDDDSSGGNYSISLKIDGVLKQYTSAQVEEGYYIDEPPLYRLTFKAEDGTDQVYITLFDTSPLTEKNYVGYTVNQTNTNVTIKGPQISIAQNGLYYNSITSENHNDISLDVTNMTSNTMRGTFNGIVKRDGEPDISITEGEFFIPYKKSED